MRRAQRTVEPGQVVVIENADVEPLRYRVIARPCARSDQSQTEPPSIDSTGSGSVVAALIASPDPRASGSEAQFDGEIIELAPGQSRDLEPVDAQHRYLVRVHTCDGGSGVAAKQAEVVPVKAGADRLPDLSKLLASTRPSVVSMVLADFARDRLHRIVGRIGAAAGDQAFTLDVPVAFSDPTLHVFTDHAGQERRIDTAFLRITVDPALGDPVDE